jgi:8-oxo-dGTP pyrophosphatase MutT (NUDIX family)
LSGDDRDPVRVWQDPELLRRRLQQVVPLSERLAAHLHRGDDGHEILRPPGLPRPAAVLVGLVDRADGPFLLLTTRAAHLRHHAGQVSFPGGRVEADDPDPAATALREAQEEVGLPPENVRILGELGPYDTVTGFRIQPVVGWITPPAAWIPDPLEVADVFEMPLGFAVNLANHRRERRMRDGRMREYWTMPWNGHHVWGATAGIIVNFVRLLAWRP